MAVERFAVPIRIPDDNPSNDSDRTVTVRVVPYRKPIVHRGDRVQFDPGSVKVDPARPVPVTVDHGNGVLDRVGRLDRYESTDDGLYAVLRISDTQDGRDIHTLLRDGVITDVSAGVDIDPAAEYRDDLGIRHRAGDLDHIGIVTRGAFAAAGSKVLAVHNEGNQPMDELQTPDPAPAVDVEKYATADQVADLAKMVAALQIPGAVTETPPREEFSSLADFFQTFGEAQAGDPRAQKRIADYALAEDSSSTVAGIVPSYRSREIISIIDTSRPFISAIPRDPIGSVGMAVDYPEVTQKPQVGQQSAENAEVASRAMTIGTKSVPLVTHAGANKVSRQAVDRSNPTYVNTVFREFADQYARSTSAAAATAAATAVTASAILADLGADAAATFGAVNTGNLAIIAGVRAPATHWMLAPDRWGQLNKLVDSTGRPLLTYPDNGPSNALGQSGFNVMTAQYHGLTVFLEPDAPAGTAILFNRDRFAAALEQDPVQLRAEIVSTLSYEMGVYGLFALVVKYAAGGYKFTLAADDPGQGGKKK